MRETSKCTFGEFLAVALVGVASPIIRIVISRTAASAGKASWLSPIFGAAAVVVIVFFVLDSCSENGTDMLDALSAVFGNVPGRIIGGVYGVFVLVVVSMVVREYAERLVSTIFPGWNVWIFTGTLIFLCLFAALRSLHTLGLAAKIFGKIILAIGGVVLLFSLKSVNINNALPVGGKDALSSAKGIMPTISAFSALIHMGFLMRQVQRRERGKTITALSCIGVCLIMAATIFVTIGVFGAEYVAHSSISFFALAKGVKIFDVAQHIESIVVAAWVLSDFVLVAVEIMTIRNIFGRALGIKKEKYVGIIVAAALFAAATWGYKGTMQIEEKIAPILQPLNVVVNMTLAALIWGMRKLRQKRSKNFEKSS